MWWEVTPTLLVFSNAALVAVGTLNATLALLILFSSATQRSRLEKVRVQKFWFALLSLSVGVWTFSMVNFRSSTSNEEAYWFAILLHIVPLAIPLSFLKLIEHSFAITQTWLWAFPHQAQWYHRIRIGFFLLFFATVALTIFSHLVIQSVQLVPNSEPYISFGPLFFLYALYIVGAFSFTLFLLLLHYIHLRHKKQLRRGERNLVRWLLYGSTVAVSIPLITNLLLPWLGIYDFNWVGNLATLVWISALYYAFNRFQFLNLKIFSIEVLVFVIWIILAVRAYLAAQEGSPWIDFVVLLLALFIGILLMQSMHQHLTLKERYRALALRLQEANQRLQELDRQKTEFLSIASHQLRGPVAVVRGYASLLKEGAYGALPAAIGEIVDRIEQAATAMAQMVEDFLNVTRIEQGRMHYEMRHFDLADLVQEICRSYRQQAQEKGLSFSCSIKPAAEGYSYYGDAVKLQQVISNLVENAIKYTTEGSVAVTLRREVKPQPAYCIEVQDTGIGIPPEELPSLFSKFHRASNAQETNVAGTGLGLYVAKKLVEAHGGTIRAYSEGRGKGSRFCVLLPVNTSQTASRNGQNNGQKEVERTTYL